MSNTSSDAPAIPAWRAEADAHKRAMPPQRLLGNGMDYADVVDLYARVDGGQPWNEAAEALGQINAERAQKADDAGHVDTARAWFLAAAACFRVGQVPVPDSDPSKRSMYVQLVDAYGRAGSLSTPATEHVDIPWRGGTLTGWLLRPPTTAPATVIVVGGFDGWREEYHVGATHLVERGLAVLLIDGPGQGETRLFGGLNMDTDVTHAFSTMVDFITSDARLGNEVGIWGNSMGGYLAAAVAIAEPRITACCVNGGTVRPAEFPERFPRLITKVQSLLGESDPAVAMKKLEAFVLDANDLADLRCPLLVLHGTPDQVFLVANARRLYDGAGSTDKTWLEWSDGDHCIYNHSLEKHTIISDWFFDHLNG